MINLLVTILAGALIGWIASMIMKTNASMGALANIVAGIIGAAIGGFIFSGGRSFGSPDFNIGSLLVGIIGACILIGILKLVSGKRTAV